MGFFNRFLIVKVTIIVLVAVLCGFSVSAWLTAERQLRTLERLHEQGASSLAQSLATGVRNTMLRGDGLAVSEFLRDAKERISLAEIDVYAPTGEAVFGARPAPPALDALPVHVREVLATSRPASHDGLHAYPIANEERCKTCHLDGDLRGVLTLGTEAAPVSLDTGDAALQALSMIARSGFVQIMTGRKDEDIEDYFAALVSATPGIEGVAVLDDTGEPYFMGGSVSVTPESFGTVLQTSEPLTVRSEESVTRLVPLPMEPRCKGCHEGDETMRGALAVRFEANEMRGHETLRQAVTTSLQHVMLAGLGRLVVGFIDEVG
jgi:hypothetical protein